MQDLSADPAAGPATLDPRHRGTPRLIAVALVALAAILVIWLAFPGTPSDSSPEAGFSRDMGTHHAQAEEMSFIIRDKTEDKDLRSLTYDIITSQAGQRGRMTGWLEQWGLPQSRNPDQPPMSWMDDHHDTGRPIAGALMPGMATKEELDKLRESKGKDAEILFLQLMIKHHIGGVDMAKAVVTRTSREEVASLAQKMINAQSSEISLMTDMLKDRGAKPPQTG